MVFAPVLSLEVLGWQTRLAIAMPYSVRKETFQRHFLNRSIAVFPSDPPFAATFEHQAGWMIGMTETQCQSLPVLHLKWEVACVHDMASVTNSSKDQIER